MQKIKLDKRGIIFISLAIFLLAEIFFLVPLGIRRLRQAAQEVRNLKESIATTKIDWPRRQDYLEEIKELSKKIEKHQKKAITPGQEARLISFISQGSRDYSVKINSITPLDSFSSDNQGFDYLPFQIEAESSFYNFKKFLKFLQESTYFFELKELTIKNYNPSKIRVVLCGLRRKN